MKRNRCLKCGTMRNMTEHHIVPKCHGGKGGKNKAPLCRLHHDELEKLILVLEGVVEGERVKRTGTFYHMCLRMYIQWGYKGEQTNGKGT